MDHLQPALKDHLTETFPPSPDAAELGVSSPPTSAGIRDSRAAMHLGADLQGRFGFVMEPQGHDPDDHGWLEGMACLIRSTPRA